MKYSTVFTQKIFSVILALTLVLAGSSFAQDDPFANAATLETSLDEEMAWLQAETFVITASRVLESIRKSASSITVLTDTQLRQMGARHLADALRMVPGMGVMFTSEGIYKFDARGILKGGGQHMLLMINSHPLNDNFFGGAMVLYDTTLLDNVQRIEVIRGPGSALYGANAFAGVINIITSTADEIDGIEGSARGGNFGTQEYNALFGKSFGNFAIDGNLNYFNSNGAEFHIAQDAVMAVDRLAGQYGFPPASLAPTTTSPDDQKYDASLRLHYNDLSIEGRYIERKRDLITSILGTFAGEDRNTDTLTTYNVMLKYESQFSETLTVSSKLYRNFYNSRSRYRAYPAGTLVATPTGPTLLGSQGLLAEPERKEDRTGVEVVLTYTPWEHHTFVAGGNYEKMELYDVTYAANFLYTPVQNVIVLLPSVQDLSAASTNYAKEASRTFQALFIEDLWDLREDMRLTIGARYDDYSDFGSSFNPRAGFTWEFIDGYDTKILYGRAFRAPSFYELYSQNNPAIVGNPNLEPETVDTYEISLGADVTDALKVRVTGFRNNIKKAINSFQQADGRAEFQNKEELRSQGADLEATYDFGKGIYLTAHYTLQDVVNVDTDERYRFAPQHKGSVLLNVRLSKYVNVSTDMYLQGKYTRLDTDLREDIPGFAILNATIIIKNFWERLELRGSVYNLFDADYRYPSDNLPDDSPQPGRSLIVELRYAL